jgi:hypothetical protein
MMNVDFPLYVVALIKVRARDSKRGNPLYACITNTLSFLHVCKLLHEMKRTILHYVNLCSASVYYFTDKCWMHYPLKLFLNRQFQFECIDIKVSICIWDCIIIIIYVPMDSAVTVIISNNIRFMVPKTSDWILRFIFQLLTWLVFIIGLRPSMEWPTERERMLTEYFSWRRVLLWSRCNGTCFRTSWTPAPHQISWVQAWRLWIHAQ